MALSFCLCPCTGFCGFFAGGDGLPNKKEPAVWSGQSSFDQQQIVLGVDLYQWMISYRDLIHSHMPGHANALFRLSALTAPGCAGCDGAGGAVLALGAVRGTLAAEMMALHHTSESLAFALADHIHILHAAEQLDIDLRAGLEFRRILQTNFMKMPLGPDAALGRVADQGLAYVLGLGVFESELDGVVSIRFDRLHLRDIAWASQDDGHGNGRSLLIENPGHPDLGA